MEEMNSIMEDCGIYKLKVNFSIEVIRFYLHHDCCVERRKFLKKHVKIVLRSLNIKYLNSDRKKKHKSKYYSLNLLNG